MPITKHSLIESFKEISYNFGMKVLEKSIPEVELRSIFLKPYIDREIKIFEDHTWKEIMKIHNEDDHTIIHID